jgi:hypothetical protein
MTGILLAMAVSGVALQEPTPQARDTFRVVASEDPGMIPACYLRRVLISDGRIKVTAIDDQYEEAERARSLSAPELARLRRAVERSDFFSLPKTVGCFPTEAGEHSMFVESGERTHTVLLYERGSHPTCATSAQVTNRAFAVWQEILAAARFAVAKSCK